MYGVAFCDVLLHILRIYDTAAASAEPVTNAISVQEFVLVQSTTVANRGSKQTPIGAEDLEKGRVPYVKEGKRKDTAAADEQHAQKEAKRTKGWV